MKKIFKRILFAGALIGLAFGLAGCREDNRQADLFREEYRRLEEKCQFYLDGLEYALRYEWDENIDNDFYTWNGSLHFQATLEILYEYDNGKEMENIEGYAKVDDYIVVSKKYFPADPDEVRKLLLKGYDEGTDRISMSDGLGSMSMGVVNKIEVDGDLLTVTYDYGVWRFNEEIGDYALFEPWQGVLTICRQGDEFRFLSNKKCDEAESTL